MKNKSPISDLLKTNSKYLHDKSALESTQQDEEWSALINSLIRKVNGNMVQSNVDRYRCSLMSGLETYYDMNQWVLIENGTMSKVVCRNLSDYDKKYIESNVLSEGDYKYKYIRNSIIIDIA